MEHESGANLLRIFLLGQFKLEANNLPLELPSRPAQSLLAYLVLNAGVTHRREKVAGLLWPEASEENARRYLRQALWRIRKSLEGGNLAWENYLHINDIEITFNEQADVWVDVRQLLAEDESHSLQNLIEVASRYQGELLPGFYDEWLLLERDRVQAAHQQKMNRLLEGLLQAGRFDEALKWGEQWLRLGNWPESAYRALLRAYAGMGDQGMVQATYRRCLQTLARELDVQPSPETQQLYEQIRCGDFAAPPLSAQSIQAGSALKEPAFLDSAVQPPTESTIFVAREAQLEKLQAFLNQALAGRGQVVFVTGEAGSGKTALIDEFSRRAQKANDDLIVALGNCNVHTGIGDPYLPFREVLALLTGDVEAQWAAAALSREHARRLWQTLPLAAQALVQAGPGLINTFIPGHALARRVRACASGRPTWIARIDELASYALPANLSIQTLQQSDLFEQVTRVLQLLAQQVPLLLLIDDLQWADPGSTSLLFHLGRRLAGNRILIVGAYRPEEINLEQNGKRNPLQSLVNEFQRLSGDIMIDVGQMQNREFVEALIDSEPNRLGPSFRQMLHRQTNGHPLFTIELLRGMQERGDLLKDEEGLWVESLTLDWGTLPARVEAVIAERIARLSSPLQETLQVACVEGETFTAEVIARIRGIDARQTLTQLSGELDKRHHLISAQSIKRIDGQTISRYKFHHNLFQKYIYTTLDEVQRVHLHEQVGIALEKLYCIQVDRGDIAPQLARHFIQAGITEKAIEYLHLAGERAVRMFAYQEANTHLGEGLKLLSSQPETPQRAQKELDLQFLRGMALIWDIPSPERERIYVRARDLCRQLGNVSQLSRVLGELSVFHYVRAQYPQARALAAEALALAEQDKNPLLSLINHWQLGFILFGSGDFNAARDHLKQIITVYDPSYHHDAYVVLRGSDAGMSALAFDACCLWCLGYPDQALQRSRESLELARKNGHAFSTADVLCFSGCLLSSMSQDIVTLKDSAAELMKLSRDIGFLSWLGSSICYCGESLAKSGQLQAGIEQMEKGIAMRELRDSRCNASGILGALAEAQAMEGHFDKAATTLAQAFDLVKLSGERFFEAELYRLQGELLLRQNMELEGEACLQQSLRVAGSQQAKSWELRTAISLAKLWQNQGKYEQAKCLLAPIYGWFKEGFETKDLQLARKLLTAFDQ